MTKFKVAFGEEKNNSFLKKMSRDVFVNQRNNAEQTLQNNPYRKSAVTKQWSRLVKLYEHPNLGYLEYAISLPENASQTDWQNLVGSILLREFTSIDLLEDTFAKSVPIELVIQLEQHLGQDLSRIVLYGPIQQTFDPRKFVEQREHYPFGVPLKVVSNSFAGYGSTRQFDDRTFSKKDSKS